MCNWAMIPGSRKLSFNNMKPSMLITCCKLFLAIRHLYADVSALIHSFIDRWMQGMGEKDCQGLPEVYVHVNL